MLKIVAHDRAWRVMFEAEAAALRAVMGSLALRIEHVGSTSVDGLPAKPVIDIQVSVASLQTRSEHAEILAQLGYMFVSLGEFDRVYPFFAKPANWPSTHHVHLCVAGSTVEADHLAFRDCLRRQPDVAKAYVELKHKLAAANRGDTLASRERYSLGKTEFVRKVLMRPGGKAVGVETAWQLRLATPGDIQACVILRGQTRQNAVSVERLAAAGITPQSWADDVRAGRLTGFVCTDNAAIVGYCFADVSSGEVVVLALLPPYENQGIGRRLLDLAVGHLGGCGHRRVFLGCAADPAMRSHGFYRRLGWVSTASFDRHGDEILEFFPQPGQLNDQCHTS